MGFSVLMSVYAKEKPEYLSQALESVVKQTQVPDEIVLIKDGVLTRELEDVVLEFQSKYEILHTYQFETNVQLGRALAKGVELCRYELIARMDTDDIAVSDRFEKQYQYMMAHPEISALGGWMEEFNDEETYSRVKKMPECDAEIRKYAKYRNPLNHMTVMFRREAVLQAGNYRHFPFLEDYDLWSRMLVQQGEFHNIPAVFVRMRNNDSVYKRRGGFSYFIQYAKLRKLQREIGLTTRPEYVKASVLTLGMTLQPTFLRKLVYQKILRK